MKSERGAATVAAPHILRFRCFSAKQRLDRNCFFHRLFAMDVDLSRCRHGGGTGLLGFAATLESLLGPRLRTWIRIWRASTTDHGGATVAPPSLLELYWKPENQVLSAREGLLRTTSIVRRGSRVRNRPTREVEESLSRLGQRGDRDERSPETGHGRLPQAMPPGHRREP
jgi:hypothetical protein